MAARSRDVELWLKRLPVSKGKAKACVDLGWHKERYKDWQRAIPGLKERADAILDGAVLGSHQFLDVPDFLSFRERYFGHESFWFHHDAWAHIEREQQLLMLLPPGHTKALDLNTDIPTPTGWTTMGEIAVGDEVFDERGEVCRVRYVSPVYLGRPCYEVEFNDGSRIVADEEHLWFTRTRKPQHGRGVRTTRDLYETQTAHGRPNHGVPVQGGLRLPERDDLPFDPYLVGCWLGDGGTRSAVFSTADPELLEAWRDAGFSPRHIAGYDYYVKGIRPILRAAGVFGNKHIPAAYLRASEKQRLALLQGLMDTDGTATKYAECRFVSTDRALALGVRELALSLGFKPKWRETRAVLRGKDCGPAYSVAFYAHRDRPVFRLDRKWRRQKSRAVGDRDEWRIITSVRPVASRPVRCIGVDSPSRLFLAGESMVPTHNTMTWSIEHAAWRLIKDPDYRITIIQKSADEAEKIVSAVQQRLADHEFYQSLGIPIDQDPITLWGPFKPERRYREAASWGASAITVTNRHSGEKEPSLQAKGASSAILSTRADLIIVDDAQEPLKDTPIQTENLLRWMQQSILTRLYPHQKIVVLGSRLGPTDIYQRLMDEYPDWPLVKYPAILPACKACMDANIECEHPEPERLLWPGYPGGHEGLMKTKARVRNFWFSSYMQEEGSFEDMVFKPESLNLGKQDDFLIGQVPPQVTHVVVGCDPAIVQFCAIVTWGLDARTGTRYLIDVFNEKGLRTFSNIQRHIAQTVQKYGPRVVAIEMNNVQGSISNDPEFVRELRGYGAQVITYQTRTQMGARAEADDFDISSVGALFDAGLVVLPYGDEASRKVVDAYVAQLTEWRPGVKYLVRDMVMATLFAESQARELYLRAKNRSEGRYIPRVPRWVARRHKERSAALGKSALDRSA